MAFSSANSQSKKDHLLASHGISENGRRVNPHMKWKYFTHTWRDVNSWKDAVNPRSWIPSGKAALLTLWFEYKTAPLDQEVPEQRQQQRERSPDPFSMASDMTLVQTDDDEVDELDKWMSERVFELDEKDTLPKFWLRALKNKTTAKLAQMGLDMVSIPAMSSECERVFSQAKLFLTSQRGALKVDIIEATQCLRMWMILDRKRLGKWSGVGNWVLINLVVDA